MIPPPEDNPPKAGAVPPPWPAPEPPVIGAPPALDAGFAPPIAAANRRPGSGRKALAIFLSICLGLFLADAIISLCDDSLGLFFHTEALSVVRGIVFTFAVLAAIVTYALMALTPMVPKRWFLPLTLFNPAGQLVVIPFMIYFYARLPQVIWCVSLCQVILGLIILYCAQGALRLRWPLVPVERIESRPFSWLNLAGFIMANVFVLLPTAIGCLFLCASMAAEHFSEGFVAVRPGGITVQERKYVRDDGKTIELYPMVHVAESEFYRSVLQSFPSNAVILMEGVTDNKNLLTNKISYKRMATALGLSEQHEGFKPSPGEMVRADVDVGDFSTNTIAMLNMAMLVHTKGLNAGTLMTLMQFQEAPNFQDELIDDLLTKRNQHLLGEIRSRLSKSGNIIVPWGAAHMPGLAKEIQKSGFRLEESHDYLAIRFGPHGNKAAYEKVK